MDTNNTRIAKNTLFLYLRMIIYIIINLYTSRLVLEALGIIDYGIYNVVAGIVLSFNLLNFSMTQSTLRFLSFELGKNNINRLREVFSTSINIQVFLLVLIAIILEIMGYWFLNNELNIPDDRLLAAKFVFQMSILSFVITALSTPFKSLILSNERMKSFAYISVLETIIKLSFVLFLITLKDYDILKLFSLVTVLSSTIILVVYSKYCFSNFKETRYVLIFNKELNTEMFSFFGWNSLSNSGNMMKSQGANILINIFFGPAINAARGVAYQVEGVIIGFVLNFQQAINPQITKLFASGKKEEMINLIFKGSRYSFCLISVIFVPLLVHTNFILELWLKEVPEFTVIFLQLVLLISLQKGMVGLFDTGIQATGKIKFIQIIVFSTVIIDIPLCYLILSLGYPAYSVMYIAMFTEALVFICKILYLRFILKFNLKALILDVILKSTFVFILALICSHYLSEIFNQQNILEMFVSILFSFFTTALLVFYIGLTKLERNFVVAKIKLKKNVSF